MFKKGLLLLIVSVSLTCAASPITFTDAANREITLEKPAERVAILYNYTDYAAVAGEECFERVVGIGKKAWYGWRNGIWNHYAKVCPEIEEIEDVGLLRYGDFYMEQAIALAPEVMILPMWQYDAISEVQKKQFQDANIELVVTDYASQKLESHITSTIAIGHVIGKVDRAEDIVTFYREQINDVIARVGQVNQQPNYYVEKGQKGALNQDETWSKVVWGQMGDTAGGKNIADGVIKAGKNGTLTSEKVLFSNPEHIFITGSHWVKNPDALSMGYIINQSDANNVLVSYKNRLGWSDISAVKSGQLYGVHHGLARSLMDFSAIQFMAAQFYPDKMEGVDAEANLIKFHEKFLPVDYQGSWLFQAQF
ncbi:ABC transporter substrate-binding protein [Thaumasiovibrio sp. DFM-14]|uniref:ABC transporter substrate-binding protein n=1 Tax=Thaumasiovibrio sp. DFM-14 TaxID=3384792 RepID=UPI0039A062FD